MGCSFRLRQTMDKFINSIAYNVIMFTFPIMLCVEGPLDFVKDCTAIFFLTTLDDTGFEKSKNIDQMLTRLKFNRCFERVRAKGHLLNLEDPNAVIPLQFTPDEAASIEYKETEWDQFDKQRKYVSPYFAKSKVEAFKDKPLLIYMQE